MSDDKDFLRWITGDRPMFWLLLAGCVFPPFLLVWVGLLICIPFISRGK